LNSVTANHVNPAQPQTHAEIADNLIQWVMDMADLQGTEAELGNRASWTHAPSPNDMPQQDGDIHCGVHCIL
jgi:hypothetical protein